MKNKRAWLFFAVLVTGFLYCNLIRISGVVVLPPLMESLGIGAGTIGFLSSLFFYTYGGTFAFWGIVMDRIGTFRTCGVSLLIAACGSLIMMLSESVFGIGLGRALSGLGLSSTFTGVLLYCAAAFPREQYAFFVGLSMVIGHSGTVLAVAPLGAALDAVGFRGVYLFFALFALSLGAVLLLNREKDPQLAVKDRMTERFSVKSFAESLKNGGVMIWKSFPLRVICLTWGISAASMSTLQGLWAVAWVQLTTGADPSAARMCATWISVGMVVGPAVGGVVTRKFSGSKSAFFVMCALIESSWLMWALLSMAGAGLYWLGVSGFLIGFFSGVGFVYMGNAVRDLTPFSQNGAVLGMINMFLYLMVIVFQWGTGVMLDLFSSASAPGGYTQFGYQAGFGLILLLQGYSFYLITKVKSFSGKSA